MSARVLDGQAVAAAIREAVLPDVHAFTAAAGRPPGLGIVLVGNDPASEIYVRNKVTRRHETGLRVDLERLPATATLDELLRAGRPAERAASVTTASWCSRRCRRRWAAGAAAACSTRSTRQGRRRLSSRSTSAGWCRAARSSSPARRRASSSCSTRSGIAIAGARAVVIGRSDIVGKPMAMLLLHRDATVTICHSRTPDLPAVAATADILVAAIGRPGVRDARTSSSRARR